jgi:hypothetical protein
MACNVVQTEPVSTKDTIEESFQTYPSAIIEPKLVRASIEIEKRLNQREGIKASPGQRHFEVVSGSQPIIITAPHSVRPFRKGKYRFSDGGATAAYALALADLVGAHVIYASYENETDANYEDDNDFKRQLAVLIEQLDPVLILDIHGSNPMRSYDLDIGTMNGKSLLGQPALVTDLRDRLAAEGIVNISYNRFSASQQQTITKFSSNKGVPTLQLEINATYLMPSEGAIEAQRFAILLQGLTRYIRSDILMNNNKN